MFCSFILCLLLVGFYHVSAVDHASRLEDIISRKVKESHAANANADNLLKNAKVRSENNLAVAKSKRLEVSNDAKRVHDDHVEFVSERNQRKLQDAPAAERKMDSTLRAHGVSDSLVREINNMASSYIPRETIVRHVQTHFPNKDQHEWNDIVISAISAAGKAQPDSLDTAKSSTAAATFQKEQFARAKRSMENQQD